MPTRKTTIELRAEIAKLKKTIKRLEAKIKTNWQHEYWRQYVRESGFKPYGKVERIITIPMVAKLK